MLLFQFELQYFQAFLDMSVLMKQAPDQLIWKP